MQKNTQDKSPAKSKKGRKSIQTKQEEIKSKQVKGHKITNNDNVEIIEATPELIQEIEFLYENQNYTEDQMVIMDEYDIEIQEQENGDQQYIIDSILLKSDLRKLDLQNIIFPGKRIHEVIRPGQFMIELRMNGCKIISSECIEIAKNPQLSQLRLLDLSCNAIKLTGLLHLIGKDSVLTNLKKLDLFYCQISHSQLEQVPKDEMNNTDHIKLNHLQNLNLSYNKLGPLVKYLFMSKNFGFLQDSLDSLFLVETELDDDLIQYLIESIEKVPNLRELDLSHNNLTNSYVQMMNTLQKRCQILTNLSLASCKYSSTTMNITIDRFSNNLMQGFTFLKRLDLSSSIKGETQIEQLASSQALEYLEFLKLKNCGVTNIGFTQILGSKCLRNLKVLILSKNKISKLVFPFNDLKQSNKIQQKREIMQLDILDLRDNYISSTKIYAEFLQNTMVLAWDNQIKENYVQQYLSNPELLHNCDPKAMTKKFNPLAILNPSPQQKQLVEFL